MCRRAAREGRAPPPPSPLPRLEPLAETCCPRWSCHPAPSPAQPTQHNPAPLRPALPCRVLALLPRDMVDKAENIVSEIEAEIQSQRETLEVRESGPALPCALPAGRRLLPAPPCRFQAYGAVRDGPLSQESAGHLESLGQAGAGVGGATDRPLQPLQQCWFPCAGGCCAGRAASF